MPKLIAFDFYGVLCSPMYGGLLHELFPGNEEKWNEWMKIVEHDVDIGDLSEDAFIEKLAAATGWDPAKLKVHSYSYAILNIELLDLIRVLRRVYKIGLLTNAPRSLIENILEEKLTMFDAVAISGDVHSIKPDPAFFKYFIEKTGVTPAEILFIDDNAKNVAAAETLGMKAVQYKTNKQVQDMLLVI